MKTIRTYCLIMAVLLWTGFLTCVRAIALPVDSAAATSGGPSTFLANNEEGIASTSEEPAARPKPKDPIELLLADIKRAAAAPAGYPGGSPSSWSPTHFEIFGDVQWRNLSSNSGFSSSYCLPSGCVTNTGSFRDNLGFTGFSAGPHFGFIWTPEKKILGATSKVWVGWQQLNRSRTRTISGEFVFDGVTYVVNTSLRAELKTKQFTLGYAPRWGNDKFRIGPDIEYQRLSVGVTLTNLSPGAPPPITQNVDVPNNIVLIGIDFDYTPVKQFDVFGRTGWIPCCGGGWHENETEVGAKYYIRRNFSILGGVRYYYLKRDFNLPAQVVTTPEGSATLGPFSGFIKFPGIGPFVGASFRF